MLQAFLSRPNQVLTKGELARLLWPEDHHRDFDRAIHNLISKLRRMHPQGSSWFDTVHKAGYRFCVPVVEQVSTPEEPAPVPPVQGTVESAAVPDAIAIAPAEEPAPQNAAAPVIAEIPPTRGLLRRWVFLGAASCVVALCAWGWWKFTHHPASEAAPVGRPIIVGVLPLAATGIDQATADTLRGALSDALAALPNVEVRAEHSLSSLSGASSAELQGTARGLKLDDLLAGTLVTSPSGYTLNLELIRASDNAHVRSLHYEGSMAALGATANRVAEDLAPRLLASNSRQEAQHMLGGTTSEAAYDLAFRANGLLLQRSKESVTEAVSLYKKAIEIDPRFAGAWAGLSESHLVLANFGAGGDTSPQLEQARAAATQAISLDESNAQAHSTLGLVLLQHDWKFAPAEREMRLAISIAPGSAVHHLHLALLLTDEGRFAEAFGALDRAKEVDPGWPVVYGTSMFVHISARAYDAALLDAHTLTSTRPEWSRAHRHLGWALWYAGKHADAVNEWIMADELDKRPQAAQSEREGLKLLNQKGVRAYAENRSAAQLNPQTASDDFVAAEWYAFAGDKANTLTALEAMVKERNPESLKIASNPAYDFVRSDPRFVALINQLGTLTGCGPKDHCTGSPA